MSAELDFVVYLGDPDEGATALSSKALVDAINEHKNKLEFPHVYGAVLVKEGGRDLVDVKSDPILPLVTKFVRTIPYIIEGEAETILLSESEHGFALEPSGDDVMISFFAGDPFEPDEFLLEQKTVELKEMGEQVLSMGERMRDILKAVWPESFEDEGEGKSLEEFIDTGRDAFKTFKLELERGLRVQ